MRQEIVVKSAPRHTDLARVLNRCCRFGRRCFGPEIWPTLRLIFSGADIGVTFTRLDDNVTSAMKRGKVSTVTSRPMAFCVLDLLHPTRYIIYALTRMQGR